MLATLRTFKAGFWLAVAVPNVAKGTFTIYLNKAPARQMLVAWFAID